MAEYEPFPTGSEKIEGDRALARKVVGCFGLGSLGVIGAVVAAMVVIGAFASFASGCDIDVGDPGEGKDSQHLAVGVAPAAGLSDGDPVLVTSEEFDANTIVGVAVCLQAADTQRKGVDACDQVHGSRFAVGPDGHLEATYLVPRVITVRGTTYDCATKAERCLLVAADANDYDESGGQPLRFRSPDSLPAPDLVPVTERPVSEHLPIGARPSVDDGPVAPGTELTVLATGFQPGEPLLVAYCAPEVEQQGFVGTCEPLDESAALGAVMFRSLTGDLPRANASGAFTTSLEARAGVVPYGADFVDEELGASSTTSTTERGGKVGEVGCTDSA
ncbi:MAG: neocarzinostatin apoprotein domain-containing protein, partial [Aquihabitans sp.]